MQLLNADLRHTSAIYFIHTHTVIHTSTLGSLNLSIFVLQHEPVQYIVYVFVCTYINRNVKHTSELMQGSNKMWRMKETERYESENVYIINVWIMRTETLAAFEVFKLELLAIVYIAALF